MTNNEPEWVEEELDDIPEDSWDLEEEEDSSDAGEAEE